MILTADQTPTSTSKRAWRRTEHRLKFSLGGVLLRSVRFPATTLDAAFLDKDAVGTLTHYAPHLPDEIRAAIVYSQAAEQPMRRIRLQTRSIRYVRAQYRRFHIELHGTYAEYEKRFSSQRRNHLRRMVRKFAAASGGTIDWREYSGPSDMLSFHTLAREVSRTTYQEKLVDAGLPASHVFQQELTDLAERDSVRGYILFLDQKPIAYQYCPASEGVVTCERLGYDPEYRQHSPGIVLLLLTLERLFTGQRFETFDFGRGEFPYKETLATGSIPCADIYYFRKTVSNLFLVSCHAALGWCSSWLSTLSHSLGIREKLKRTLRSYYGRK